MAGVQVEMDFKYFGIGGRICIAKSSARLYDEDRYNSK
jgi:hypothetical protein